MSLNVDLLSLRAFLVVCEEGSLAKAARRLFLSEPAVSLRIRVLEERLGFPLFVRSRSGVRPTQAAQVLREQVIPTLNDLEHAIEVARATAEQIISRITLSCSPVTLSYLLPEILERFSISHPEVEIVARSSSQTQVPGDLLNGAVDCALVIGRERPVIRGWEVAPCIQDSVGLVMAPQHELARHDRVTSQDLADQRLLSYGRSLGYRQLIRDAIPGSDLAFDEMFSVESLDPLKNLVKHQLGVAFFPLVTVLDEVQQGSLAFRPLRWAPGRLLQFPTWLCTPRRHPLSEELGEIRQLILTAAGRLQTQLDVAIASAEGEVSLSATGRRALLQASHSRT